MCRCNKLWHEVTSVQSDTSSIEYQESAAHRLRTQIAYIQQGPSAFQNMTCGGFNAKVPMALWQKRLHKWSCKGYSLSVLFVRLSGGFVCPAGIELLPHSSTCPSLPGFLPGNIWAMHDRFPLTEETFPLTSPPLFSIGSTVLLLCTGVHLHLTRANSSCLNTSTCVSAAGR